MGEKLRRLLATLFVAFTLTVMAADLAVTVAPRRFENHDTFYALTGDWSDYQKVRQEWRPRLASNALASQVAMAVDRSPDQHRIRLVAAVWTALWYGLLSAALVAFTRERAVFYLFAFFSCLAFGYLPTVNDRIYPWDLPALVIFTLFALFLRRGSLPPLLLLPPLGIPFKETSIVLCVAFLFREGPWKRRLTLFAATAASCLLVKLALDLAVGVPLPGASMTVRGAVYSHWEINLIELTSLRPPFFVHPVMINAGTLVALWLLPRRSRTLAAYQTMALLFTANLLVFGRIMEYRIWFELIPLAVFALGETFLPDHGGLENVGE